MKKNVTKIFKKLAFCSVMAFSAIANAQQPTYLNEQKPIEARVKDALSRMTLEEKVALCHAQSKFSIPGVPRLGIPELWMSDGPHGVHEEQLWDAWDGARWTNDSCTAFPALTCLAATWNRDMSAIYGKAIGEEARYRRKDVLLGPGVNIYRTPLNGRNFEYMGEDPYLAAQMVVSYIVEVQKNGVAACVKHFAMNNQEERRLSINVELSDRALYEIYLPAFKAAVEQGGAWAIMGSYNKVRGEHACHNDLLLNKILKRDWAFDGTVISDWGGVHDTKQAALNGLDIEMGSYTNGLTTESKFTFNDYYLANPYIKMLKDGTVPMSTVDDKAARILRLIFRTSMNRNRPFGSFANQEHHDVARTIAEEGIVLLKNDKVGQQPLLPLDEKKYRKILVVGENATRNLMDGGGSSTLKVKKNINPLLGLQAMYGDKITYTQGYKSGRPLYDHIEEIPVKITDSLRAVAVRLAKEADLVIFVGGLNKNFQQDAEGGDRTTYNLTFGQDKLVDELTAVNKNVVMVLVSGNAIAMPWIKKVPAIVQGWFLGSEAGNALANVISGKVNPSGKLPFSFPVKLTDNGAHAFDASVYPGDATTEYYKDDIFVGYRWYDTKKIAVQYPFGHGLSYTTFAYGKPVLSTASISESEKLTVSVTVKNTGKVAGKEVVQLYIKDNKSSLPRPVKELKSFDKVALNPGEEKVVILTIDKSALSYYDDKKHDWVAEKGTFEVLIGASATDIRGKATFTLK